MSALGRQVLAVSAVLGLGLAGCASDSEDNDDEATATTADPDSGAPAAEADDVAVSMTLSSNAFSDGEMIPAEYTCDGDNLRPGFTIEGTPPEATELVLVVDDPDSPDGSFIHWVVWGIPPDVVVPGDKLPEGSVEGTNDTSGTAWFGPCPPPGSPHSYQFELSAVSATPDVAAGATADEVRAAIANTTVAEAVLVGTYERT
jgi:Raf kinase inhibitor-like YbhB/YbcL family protein